MSPAAAARRAARPGVRASARPGATCPPPETLGPGGGRSARIATTGNESGPRGLLPAAERPPGSDSRACDCPRGGWSCERVGQARAQKLSPCPWSPPSRLFSPTFDPCRSGSQSHPRAPGSGVGAAVGPALAAPPACSAPLMSTLPAAGSVRVLAGRRGPSVAAEAGERLPRRGSAFSGPARRPPSPGAPRGGPVARAGWRQAQDLEATFALGPADSERPLPSRLGVL